MQVTQMELNTLKQLIAMEDLHAKKFQLYAHNCNDTQLKNFFTQQANQAFNDAQRLMGFLH
jgi:negative regulator of genetic competence, sporulation and motility